MRLTSAAQFLIQTQSGPKMLFTYFMSELENITYYDRLKKY